MRPILALSGAHERVAQGGRAGTTLHAKKGLLVAGDVLWVADIDAVRGFDRRTGRSGSWP